MGSKGADDDRGWFIPVPAGGVPAREGNGCTTSTGVTRKDTRE